MLTLVSIVNIAYGCGQGRERSLVSVVQPFLRVLLVYIVVVVKLPFSDLLLERIIPGPIHLRLGIYLLISFVPCLPSRWFPVSVICCNSV